MVQASTATQPMARITIAEPAWKNQDTASALQAAIKLRIQNKFGDAQTALERLVETEKGEKPTLGSVWM